ncbi:DUF5682 family protein [Trichocoleus desertorum AS-A10]|uniref:DUF5682 family protein n=1 Tax=Trichocoleus desertorum TaxID=1481672 RepID=UPI0032996F6D
MEFDTAICQTKAPIVFFPVRHHSPACGRLVRQLAFEIRPSVILIEGPSDFNDRLPELTLPHQLPIAIYSYVRLPDGKRRGAFYPFCIYSPEWQALQVAQELGIPAQFIDLPWAEVATENAPIHRYADAELRQSDYVTTLCQKIGVENFDTLWDTLFEIDPELTLTQYLERCHQFCFHIRSTETHISKADLRREAFMVEAIQQARRQYFGKILVVTGGFHSYPLYEQLHPECAESFSLTPEVDASIQNLELETQNSTSDRGIALTPYSYQRLDNLTGYESGMPNPGFYHAVWQNRFIGNQTIYRSLLAQVARELRQREQTVSCADLIAVETMARGLATLRGHAEVWRQDLVDGIVGALVKEEIEGGLTHPFLQAVYHIFRGQDRGRLTTGTTLPPLVQDIQQQLHNQDLEPTTQQRIVELDLIRPVEETETTLGNQPIATQKQATALSTLPPSLQKSQLLHRLRILSISGFRHMDGSDLIGRKDLVRIWEQWTIQWTPEFDASCIEAAIYGATLVDAATARVLDLAAAIERDAEKTAILLLDACLMGLYDISDGLRQRLVELIRQDNNFFTITKALGHLLYLYRYDEVLGTKGRSHIGTLLVEIFQRSLWLLEGLGQVQGMDQDLLHGLRTVLETFECCSSTLELNADHFVQVLQRVSTDFHQTPLLRGATIGALWTLKQAAMEQVIADLIYSANPDHLGDFLTGLFYLARETVQRHPDLVHKIDDLLMAYDDESFLEALPALRLAFSYFTPREKHYMARTLLQAQDAGQVKEAAPLVDLEVSVGLAAQVLAFETRLFQAVRRYGLRGGD